MLAVAQGVDAADPSWILAALPDGDFHRIVLKPNWVRHEVSPDFPIRAMVTSAQVIEATLAACIEKYPRALEILVGDAPLQDCDFERMLTQSGADRVAAKFSSLRTPRIVFCDFRRERFELRKGFLSKVTRGTFGDPAGYREVVMDAESLLDPISGHRERFGVSDYGTAGLRSHHRFGHHRYLFAGSVLEADLLVNLPKMKTHQKAGVTGALKNLVGCNGDKACLVHYLKGRPQRGGDEFPPDIPWPIEVQVRVREALQKRSRALFRALRPLWRLMKDVYGIRTEGTPSNLERRRFYLAAGAWHGNDTIWRMVYDLNRIVRYAPPGGGALCRTPQRGYVAILDGIVAGEGNGPLQPLPVAAGVLAASDNPFAVDMAMARLMGFDHAKIPVLSRRAEFGEWGDVDAATLSQIEALSPGRTFMAPPGWRGHLEL
jgi:uncharacterized protein (DUF362 family)